MELLKIDCIVCKGKHHYIVANEDRETFRNFISFVLNILKLKLGGR